jgi:hypothetical protein
MTTRRRIKPTPKHRAVCFWVYQQSLAGGRPAADQEADRYATVVVTALKDAVPEYEVVVEVLRHAGSRTDSGLHFTDDVPLDVRRRANSVLQMLPYSTATA